MPLMHTRNSLRTRKSQKVACVCDVAFEQYCSCLQKTETTACLTAWGWDLVTCHIATIVDQVQDIDGMLEGSSTQSFLK